MIKAMRVPAKFTLCQVTFLACFSVICYEKWPVLPKNKKDGLQREGESSDRNRSDTLGESMETQVQNIISKNIPVAYSLQRTFWRDFSYNRDICDSKSAGVLHGGSQENQAINYKFSTS